MTECQRALSHVAARGLAGARTDVGTATAAACGATNSFTADTPVLMADGSRRPISEVRVGDTVEATDPTTGSAVHPTNGSAVDRAADPTVTEVVVGTDEKDLVAVDVTTAEGGRGTVTATAGHPFWVDSEQRWVPAEELEPGYAFETADHRPATVAGTRRWTDRQTVYNLTVDGPHTYYVTAGDADLLVHNARKPKQKMCTIKPSSSGRPGQYDVQFSYKRDNANNVLWNGTQTSEARQKVGFLNQHVAANGPIVPVPVGALNRKTSQDTIYPREMKKIHGKNWQKDPTKQIDHKVEIQLGGQDVFPNMWELDTQVNRSFGGQVLSARKQLGQHGAGSSFNNFAIR